MRIREFDSRQDNLFDSGSVAESVKTLSTRCKADLA